MATNSNIYGYSPYGFQSVPPFPNQQPVYSAAPYSHYPSVQMGYPQPPMYYPQYQQQPMMTSLPDANINIFPPDAILFYDDDKPYYELTNFARFGFDLEGFSWPTCEHYFQAQKFVGCPLKMDQVRRLSAPRDAFDFVRRPENKAFIRNDWSTKKDGIMYEALKAKFTQNRELNKLLLETNGRMLVEDSPHDPYWGIGRDKKGKNMLGFLLMKLREELRNSPSYVTSLPAATPVSTVEPKVSLKRSSSLSHLNLFHSTQFSGGIKYEADDPSNFLSNCFEAEFQLDTNKWPTVLHYFVAKKFDLLPRHVKKILAMKSCKEVYLYSRNSTNKLDIDNHWDLNKKSIMKEALRAKFEQNVVLKQNLLNTADRDIVEVSHDDTYWSQLANGTGRNIMGMLLSQVRLELKSYSITKYSQNPITPGISSFKQSALTSNLNGDLFKRKSLHNMPTPYYPIANTTSELIKKSPTSSKQDSTLHNLSVDLSRTKLTNSIHFFDADPLLEYSELSTFHVKMFRLDGQYWSSVQHYFQAQKYATGISQLLMDKIRTAYSPKEAYELGTDRRHSYLMVISWDSKREGVMLKALRAKFSDTTLKRVLLDTGDRYLVHDSKDEFWGTGSNGNGKNILGQFLMKIRNELIDTNSPSKHSYQYSQSNSSYSHKGNNDYVKPQLYSLSSDNDVIKFYGEYEPYYGFTPYSKHSVTVDGVKWTTLNHYFQAQKFTDQKYRNEIMHATTANRATFLAQTVHNKFTKYLSPMEKRSIMEKGLSAKHTQHPDILQSLISTGNRHLLFVHPTDIVWGTGSDMKGSNILGELLMKLRNNSSLIQLKSPNKTKHSSTDHTLSSDEENKSHKSRIDQYNSSSVKQILSPPSCTAQNKAFFPTKLFLSILMILLLIISIIIKHYV